MKGEMLVSIIMPAYNVENYIEASIKSVLNQTYSNWELIVVDDGSNDSTAQIIKKNQIVDNRIKYIYQTNSKQAKARNNGIKNAKGEILAFLDSDDLWLPNKLEKTLNLFDQNNYDLIFTNSYYSSDSEINPLMPKFQTMNVLDTEYRGKTAIKAFIDGNKIPILTVLVKKDIVKKVGLFDEECVPAEDYDLWLKLLKEGYVFKSVSHPLSIYRVQESSSTAADRFATISVLKSISKNFTYSDIKQIEASMFLTKWIRRWIKTCLTPSNIDSLKYYLKHFNYNDFILSCIFVSRFLVGFNIFKRLILKKIS
ncbi:glycosyltransferase family 2 protein [Flavobacterium sp.]|uniref:glycosyltransferase family 2 protein n=1 Tax=Flavobacterium sp. TaxID=239 RepID=UPI0031D20214